MGQIKPWELASVPAIQIKAIYHDAPAIGGWQAAIKDVNALRKKQGLPPLERKPVEHKGK